MKAEALKQRILGAVALLLLGTVVWLLLFGASPSPDMDTRSQIPPQPAFTPFEVAEPRVPEGAPEAPAASESRAASAESQPLPEADAPTPAPQPGLDEETGLPVSWVVQVASLGKRERALELRDQLRERGYKAYLETVTTDTGEATRVLIGPKLSRERAEEVKVAVDEAFSVSSLISRFEP